MKKVYEVPEISVLFIESTDVICGSGPIELPYIPINQFEEEDW